MTDFSKITDNEVDLAIPTSNSGSLADTPKRTRLNTLIKKLKNNSLWYGFFANTSSFTHAPGQSVSGSELMYSDNEASTSSGLVPEGTWQCLGSVPAGKAGLYAREG